MYVHTYRMGENGYTVKPFEIMISERIVEARMLEREREPSWQVLKIYVSETQNHDELAPTDGEQIEERQCVNIICNYVWW